MKKAYSSIFDKLSQKVEPTHIHSRVLLVDSLNTFIRSFAIINQMNIHGHHIGGLTGFLRSLGYAIKTFKPTRVILVFDGLGGSTSKRMLFPDYKSHRKITRISNWDAFDTKEDESDSITSQVIQLIKYLKMLPVDLLIIDKVEADDVIGYLSSKFPEDVYIMSTDKDYLQLVNEKVFVYNPTKKKLYSVQEVQRECIVHPNNFLNYKVLYGDQSDNIPGIKGLGIKTIVKIFPELLEEEKVSLDYLIDKSKNNLDKNKHFSKIALFEKQLKINERLMDITNPSLSDRDIQEIQDLLADPKRTMDINGFIKQYNEDLLGKSIMNPQVWLREVFSYLTNIK